MLVNTKIGKQITLYKFGLHVACSFIK